MFRNAAPLVYGTLTVGVVLDAESTRSVTYLETVGAVALTMVLVWLAHSYAELVGRQLSERDRFTLRVIGETAAQELSILTGASVPLLVVLLSWAAGATLATAVTVAIWTSVAMLVVTELVAGIRAELSWFALTVQTAFGTLLGLGIISLRLVLH